MDAVVGLESCKVQDQVARKGGRVEFLGPPLHMARKGRFLLFSIMLEDLLPMKILK